MEKEFPAKDGFSAKANTMLFKSFVPFLTYYGAGKVKNGVYIPYIIKGISSKNNII